MPGKDKTRPPDRLLSHVLTYTAIGSLANGMITNGVYFVTKEMHGYSDVLNLLLALAMYAPYIPAALLAGPLSERFNPRLVQFASVTGLAVCAAVLAIDGPIWLLWVAAPLYNVCNGIQWPIVESYIVSGKHGRAMRRAVGAFNVTWSITVCASLAIVGLLLQRPQVLFSLLAGMHLLTLGLVAMWPARPAPHDTNLAYEHTGPEYGSLLKSAGLLLLFAYVLMYALSPLLPGVWVRLDVPIDKGAYWSSTWLFARVIPFVVLLLWSRWHGRWSLLAIGSVCMIVGFVATVLSPNSWVLLAALTAFGIGQGIIYTAALYYRMAVGQAQVASGGAHEAIIGTGYATGPAIALLGYALVRNVQAGVLAGVGVATLILAVTAIQPYLRTRRER